MPKRKKAKKPKKKTMKEKIKDVIESKGRIKETGEPERSMSAFDVFKSLIQKNKKRTKRFKGIY